MRHQQRPCCGGMQCGCPKQIVYPVKQNCVHHCTESVVEHIHPSHTTVMNHHLVKNKHVFPHTTSVQNTCNSVDVNEPPFNKPIDPGFNMPANQCVKPSKPCGCGGQSFPGANPGVNPNNQHANNSNAMNHCQHGFYPGMGARQQTPGNNFNHPGYPEMGNPHR